MQAALPCPELKGLPMGGVEAGQVRGTVMWKRDRELREQQREVRVRMGRINSINTGLERQRGTKRLCPKTRLSSANAPAMYDMHKQIPSLRQLGFSAADVAATTGATAAATGASGAAGLLLGPRPAPALRGGEAAALVHMKRFLSDLRASSASESAGQGAGGGRSSAAAAAGLGRNANGSGAGGGGSTSAFSCQVSPWLAAGCLSPRLVYHEALKHMPRASGNAGSLGSVGGAKGVGVSAGGMNGVGVAGAASGPGAWLVLELMWRDFFRFITHKYTQAGLGAEAGRKVPAAAGVSMAGGAALALA